MFKFYLMAIAGNLSTIACILFFVSLFALIVLTIMYCTYDEYDEKKENIISIIKKVLICFVLSCIFSIFVPSSNQMTKIYGIGGTIDYFKSNEIAKQIPDKCIKALDLYIDNQLKDSE